MSKIWICVAFVLLLVPRWAGSASLDAAEIEVRVDEAAENGDRLRVLRECAIEPVLAMQYAKTMKARYRITESPSVAGKMSSAFDRAARGVGVPERTSVSECLRKANEAGRYVQGIGMILAKTNLDAGLIPRVLKPTPETKGAIVTDMNSHVPLMLDMCVEDDELRQQLFEPYRVAMESWMNSVGLGRIGPFKNIFEPALSPREERSNKDVGFKHCPSLVFEAGMYTEMAVALDAADDSAKSKWLYKRLMGK